MRVRHQTSVPHRYTFVMRQHVVEHLSARFGVSRSKARKVLSHTRCSASGELLIEKKAKLIVILLPDGRYALVLWRHRDDVKTGQVVDYHIPALDVFYQKLVQDYDAATTAARQSAATPSEGSVCLPLRAIANKQPPLQSKMPVTRQIHTAMKAVRQ